VGSIIYILIKSFIEILSLSKIIKKNFLFKLNLFYFIFYERNILLTTLKKVKLTDFNISRKIDDTSEKHTLTTDCGTRFYKSPEILNSKYDYKTDIWYFECVDRFLYHKSLTIFPYADKWVISNSNRILTCKVSF
jgi:serine/threonine protein kinase